MQRRTFLKSIAGIAALPATNIKRIAESSTDIDVNFNIDNVKVDGTFDEWINSIQQEVRRLIKSDKFIVKIIPSYWIEAGINKHLPAKEIIILNKYGDKLTWFGFAKFEFEKIKRCHDSKKFMGRLIHVRFIDMLWSLHNCITDKYNLLKAIDSDYKPENIKE